MTTPTLTSTMFKNTSHLALSVPHITAMRNVATGTVTAKSINYKDPLSRIRELIMKLKNVIVLCIHILKAFSIWINATEMYR